jgi:photosystem II stability/assembly factor-like uncharacterized protein
MRPRRTVVFALTSLVLISTATGVTGAVWTSLGPEGGTVEDLIADPTNPAVVYARSFGGLRKSTDGGVTWADSGAGLGTAVSVTAFAIDPQNPSVLYVGGPIGKGVYKSVDGGAHWAPARTGLPTGGLFNASIDALAVDPVTATTVYAATPGGFYKTTNGGTTWSHIVTNGIPNVGSNTSHLLFDPHAPGTLYADNHDGTDPALIIKSTNGGVTWTGAGGGLPAVFGPRALLADPGTAGVFYAAFCTDGIYKTTNGGTSWFPTSTGLAATPCILSLAVDPLTPTTLYAGQGQSDPSPAQVFVSIDSGGTWTGTTLVGVEATGLATGAPNRVLAGTQGSGIFRSVDAGGSWVPSNTGLRNHLVNGIALDPSAPSTIYLGVDNGLYITSDGGTTWTRASDPLFDHGAGQVVVDPSAPATVYAAAGGGVVKTIDAGASWTFCPGSNGFIHTLSIDPAAPSHLFTGGYTGGVRKSLDGCATWATANTGLTDDFVQAFAVAPGAPSTLYVAALFQGIFRSSDTAATWGLINTGLPVPGDGLPRVVAAAPSAPTTVYASIGSQMFRSADSGDHWTLASGGLPDDGDLRMALVDPTHPDRVYIVSEGGFSDGFVMGTADGGTTWASLTADIQNPGVSRIELDATNGILYAGSNGSGLFRRNTFCAADVDCDDGNPCTVDTCNPTAPGATLDGCVFSPLDCPGDACHFDGTCDPDTGACVRAPRPGAPCQDGDPCTYDTCSDTGECVGATIPSPLCKVPVLSRASTIAITNGADDSRDRLVWQWKKGQATTADELGDPTATTGYRVCVFDNDGGPTRPVNVLAPAGGTCNGKPCWTVSGSGAHYRNPGAASNGLEQVRIQPGRYGFGKVVVKARGPNIGLPSRALSPAVTLQLVRTDDPTICWKARFNSGITRQDATTFRAKSD